ncbi:MAG TPA: ABC transporter substrate-binding protein [Acidimicrobiia bacterium]|nr:ABC transporter substrate-binding protein [Acidimicrobiia bacterium]
MNPQAPRRGYTRREILIGGVAVVVAACGPGGQVTTTGAGPTTTGAGPTTTGAGPTTTGGGGATRGGILRLGIAGGGPNDIIDGQHIVDKPDQARLVAGWETLLTYDRTFTLTPYLAEEVVAEAGDLYVIRLREGIEFHNGKTLVADDVIYSLRRLVDPDLGLFGGAALATMDPEALERVDDRTVRVHLTAPDSTFPDALAAYVCGMVPDGYTREGEQVGTGPFTLTSFTPGQQSEHARFENYWQEGKPYLDGLTLIDFPDDNARVSALLADQVDAIIDLPFAQVSVIEGNANYAVFESEGGGWLPLCMRVDTPPFDDVRVRQAFRLIVNRDEMVARALSGHGRVANDLYAPFDACYPADLPQRTQDIEEAMRLLDEAGQAGLSVELFTTTSGGMNTVAEVFAEQARAAGVEVAVRNLGDDFYGDQYLSYAFSTDFWGTRFYLPQVAAGSIPSSPFNETHWPPEGSNFEELYNQALAEPDPDARCEIISQMYEEEYNEGGYIIPFFNNLVDAHHVRVNGLQPNRDTLNLDHFGRNFTDVWLS